jgi:phosphopantothenoylcysteine decarboxylase/phosphopantothenate--cysteine ligase
VTAGPTREWLDDVRYLTNASTGRMGIEIAREARRRGARVTLVHGPCSHPLPADVETVAVDSTADLLRATRAAVRGADFVVFAAAPADFRPAHRTAGKLKKRSRAARRPLRLVETPDVAALLGRTKGRRVHVGFALEVEDSFYNALRKMRDKRFDAILLNGPQNVGHGGGRAWLLTPDGRAEPMATDDKRRLAKAILDRTWPTGR